MPLNTEFIDSSDGSELSVDLAALGAALGASPGGGAGSQALTFTNPLSVRFDRLYTSYTNHTVTAPVSFTVNPAGAVPGAASTVRLVADGINVPTFTGIKQLDGLTYDNRVGAVNYLQFNSLGAPGSLEYFVSYLQERDQVLPSTLAGTPLLFATRTANVTETAGAYSSGANPAWAQSMLSTLSLAPNTDGWFAMDSKVTSPGITASLGFNVANLNQSYQNHLYWGFINNSTVSYGTNAAITNTLTPGARYVRLKRTAGVVTFETSANGTSWTVAYTWPTPNTARLYVQSAFGVEITGVTYTHQGLT